MTSPTSDSFPADAEVRITPLSLLFSSAIGTTGIATVLGGPLVWAWSGRLSVASTPLGGVGMGALLLVLFVVGYRRHGRFVPTEARVEDQRLVVQVPRAWGKLIRDEISLTVHALEHSGDGLRVRGPAVEWWDPGTYEVWIPTTHAEEVAAHLTAADSQPAG
jgi:hypothetical protein